MPLTEAGLNQRKKPNFVVLLLPVPEVSSGITHTSVSSHVATGRPLGAVAAAGLRTPVAAMELPPYTSTTVSYSLLTGVDAARRYHRLMAVTLNGENALKLRRALAIRSPRARARSRRASC